MTGVLLGTLLLLLAAFLYFDDLPMVDLPQHAAQLSAWVYRDHPAYHADQFVLNLRTPYLLAYTLARTVAFVLPVLSALKLVAWMAIAGHAWSLRYLCHRLGHNPWLAVMGVPLGLGYNFLFGFVNYTLAVPLTWWAIGLGVGLAERPSRAKAFGLSAVLLLLLSAHGIAFAQALIFLAPLLLFGRGSFVLRMTPIFVAVIVALSWLLPGSITNRLGGDVWDVSFQRFKSFTGLLLGSGNYDVPATWMGALLLTVLILSMGPITREFGRLIPAVAILLSYLVFPAMYRGYGPLWPRFALFVVPALLLAFRPRPTAKHDGSRTGLTNALLHAGESDHRSHVGVFVTVLQTCGVIASLGWVGLFVVRLRDFNHEIAPVHQLIQSMPHDLRIRPIVFDPFCDSVPGLPALIHLPALYYVEKGGVQGYSFAMYPSSMVRYRAELTPKMTGGVEWSPNAFRFDVEASDYDCFIVHSRRDRTKALFGADNQSVKLWARFGNWSSYCHASAFPRAVR